MRAFARTAAVMAAMVITSQAPLQAATVSNLQYTVDQLQMRLLPLPGATDGSSEATIVPGIFDEATGAYTPATSGGFQLSYFTGACCEGAPKQVELLPVPGSLLPSQAVTLNSQDGVSQMTVQPGGFNANLTLDEAQIVRGQQFMQDKGLEMRWVSEAGLTQDDYKSGLLGDANLWLVTLPAYASLKVSALTSGSLSMNPDVLQGMLSRYANDETRMALAIDSGLRLIGVATAPTADGAQIGNYVEGLQGLQYDFDKNEYVLMDGPGPGLQFNQPIELDLNNDSAEARTYAVQVQFWQEAILFQNGRMSIGSDVPEPGTFVLQALGLFGLMAAVRKAR